MWFLVKRHLRRRPGQAITIALLTLLAAATLHTGLVLLTDYSTNVDRLADRWGSPAAVGIVSANAEGPALVVENLDDQPGITATELVDAFGASGTLDVSGEKMTVLVNVLNVDSLGEIGTPVITDGPAVTGRRIWAPSVLEATGSFSVGDTLSVETIGGATTFQVAGFLEDLYGGAPGMGMLTFAIAGDDFSTFDEPGFSPMVNIRADGADVAEVSKALDAAIEAAQADLASETPMFFVWGNDLNMAKQAAAMVSSIFVMMLVALALAIVAIAAVVTRFVLRNTVTGDMVSIGTLRAAGFTTWRIIGALVATYGALTLVGALLGSGLSYLLLPLLERSFRAQNGLAWEPGFSPLALLGTVAVLLAVVVLTAGFAALRVRGTTTVAALRGGVATHSFATTRLPLATTRGRLSTLLGVKAGLRQSGQNALMGLTVAVVTFAAVFTLGMVGSLLGDRAKATEIMVGTIEDVSVQPALGSDPDSLLAQIRGLESVDNAFFQSVIGINVEGRAIGFSITPDPAENGFDPVVEGRMPEHDNEVAVGGRLAMLLDLKVGSTYTLDLGQGAADFLVTGITSTARNLGQNVAISSEGFRRINPGFADSTIAVFTSDPAATIESIKAEFAAQIDTLTNQRENIEAQLGSYLGVVPVISTFMVAFTLLVTIMVVGLLVSTMLVQTKRELGIKKAMGFTNGQLGAQTRWTYLPVIAVGAFVGALLGALSTQPLLGLLLGQIGVMRVEAPADWLTTGAVALGVVAVGTVVIWLTSLRIGRVSAYALVTA